MAVSAGNLDPLFGAVAPAADLYSLHVDSYTTTGTGASERIATITANVGSADSFESTPIMPTSAFTGSAIDDTQGTVTFTPGTGIDPQPSLFSPTYILGFDSTALLLSSLPSVNIALGLDFNINQDVSLGLFSEEALSPGTVVTFSEDGSYTDSLTIVCYCSGTRIQTQDGDLPIEDLRQGDLVHAHFAGRAPINWIGRRHVDCRRHPAPHKVWPVQITAGAFGDDLPRRDLWLSAEHAVFVCNVLIPIKYLINGTTIKQIPVDEVTYYHIELPQHDVVLAEGLPAETYLDVGDRNKFEGSGALILHPNFSRLSWEGRGCAPLTVIGATVETVRRQINEQAASLRRRAA